MEMTYSMDVKFIDERYAGKSDDGRPERSYFKGALYRRSTDGSVHTRRESWSAATNVMRDGEWVSLMAPETALAEMLRFIADTLES